MPSWTVPEISDHIIDHASDEKATLAVCALVSRGFYSRSAFHLFKSITIVNDSTLLSFYRGFQSSFCRAYIKALTLGRPKPRRHRPHCPPPLHIDGGVLFDLIAALENLRPEHVSFGDVLWKPVSLYHRFSTTTAADGPNRVYVLSSIDASREHITSVDSSFLAVASHTSEVVKEAGGVDILEVKEIPLLAGPASRGVGGEGEVAVSRTIDMVVHIGDLESLCVSMSGPRTAVDSLTMRWQKDVDLSLFDGACACLSRRDSAQRCCLSHRVWTEALPVVVHRATLAQPVGDSSSPGTARMAAVASVSRALAANPGKSGPEDRRGTSLRRRCPRPLHLAASQDHKMGHAFEYPYAFPEPSQRRNRRRREGRAGVR